MNLRVGAGGRFHGALLALAVVGVSLAAPGPVLAEQSALRYNSAGTWIADPVADRIHVDLAIQATSHAVDSGTRRYFYPGLQLLLPASSVDFRAHDDTKQLSVEGRSKSSSGEVVFVDFGRRLYSGETIAFDLTFDIVDKGGSTARDLRVDSNLFSFPVSAFGTPGLGGSTVTVIFPPGFTVQQEYGDLVGSTDTKRQIVYSSGPLSDSSALDAWFTAVKPVPESDLRDRPIKIGPMNVTLRYWADDPGWADQIERVLEGTYPTLKGLVGLGDPGITGLVVEEASTLSQQGLGGEYDPATNVIAITYFADPFVTVHEMAHLWFNGSIARERWIDEAFASYYAEQTLLRLGMTDRAPRLTDRVARYRVPLNDWTAGVTAGQQEYLYARSLYVADQIAAIAGQNGLRHVWTDIVSGEAAYQPVQGPSEKALSPGPVDWRGLLDYLDQVTGHSYVAIWRSWVVDSGQIPQLDQRTSTLAMYHDAVTLAADWELPGQIRAALSGWRFSEAAALLRQAEEVLNQRAQMTALSAREGLTPPIASLHDTFERAGMPAAAGEASADLAALGAIAAAERARQGDGAAREVGLLGSDPQADLDRARDAFSQGDSGLAKSLADKARVVWEGAAMAALLRVLALVAGALVVVGLLLLAGWTRRRKRRKARAAAAAGAGSGDA